MLQLQYSRAQFLMFLPKAETAFLLLITWQLTFYRPYARTRRPRTKLFSLLWYLISGEGADQKLDQAIT